MHIKSIVKFVFCQDSEANIHLSSSACGNEFFSKLRLWRTSLDFSYWILVHSVKLTHLASYNNSIFCWTLYKKIVMFLCTYELPQSRIPFQIPPRVILLTEEGSIVILTDEKHCCNKTAFKTNSWLLSFPSPTATHSLSFLSATPQDYFKLFDGQIGMLKEPSSKQTTGLFVSGPGCGDNKVYSLGDSLALLQCGLILPHRGLVNPGYR